MSIDLDVWMARTDSVGKMFEELQVTRPSGHYERVGNGGEVCFCLGRSVGDNPFLLGHFWDRFTSSLKEATNRKGSMSHGIEVDPCLGRQCLKAAGCMTGMGLLRLFLH